MVSGRSKLAHTSSCQKLNSMSSDNIAPCVRLPVDGSWEWHHTKNWTSSLATVGGSVVALDWLLSFFLIFSSWNSFFCSCKREREKVSYLRPDGFPIVGCAYATREANWKGITNRTYNVRVCEQLGSSVTHIGTQRREAVKVQRQWAITPYSTQDTLPYHTLCRKKSIRV